MREVSLGLTRMFRVIELDPADGVVAKFPIGSYRVEQEHDGEWRPLAFSDNYHEAHQHLLMVQEKFVMKMEVRRREINAKSRDSAELIIPGR